MIIIPYDDKNDGELGQKLEHQFVREVTLLSKLHHENLIKEISLFSRLHHPNIVQYFGYEMVSFFLCASFPMLRGLSLVIYNLVLFCMRIDNKLYIYTWSMYLVVQFTEFCKSTSIWDKQQSGVIPNRFYPVLLICMPQTHFIGTSKEQIFSLTPMEE